MSLKQHMNLASSRKLTLNEKSKSQKKYFFKVSSSNGGLTFSSCFSSSPRVQKLNINSRESFLQAPHAAPTRTKSSLRDKSPRILELERTKHSMKSHVETTKRKQKQGGDKEEGVLSSTDGTHSSLIREFELILSSNRRLEQAKQEAKDKGLSKHQRTKSGELGDINSQAAVVTERSKHSPSPDSKIGARRDSKLRQYNQVEPYPEEMHQTILEFQSVLGDNPSSMNVVKKPKKEQELSLEVEKLKELLKERELKWEERLSQALVREKTLVVESFKSTLSELKKMCEWQRFGEPAISEPVTSSKKLFSSYPFQHQFKSSMEEIRGTLMELKILNSQSQTLRQQLQNLRRALEEEREMRSNVEQELQRQRQQGKRLMAELAETKHRQDECRIKLVSLENIVKLLREGKQPQYHHCHSHDPNKDLMKRFQQHGQSRPKQIIEFSVSASKIIIRDDQKNDRTRKLGDRLQNNQDKHQTKLAIESRNQRHTLQKEKSTIKDTQRASPEQQEKTKADLQSPTFTINFRSKRKVSNQAAGTKPPQEHNMHL